MNYLNLYLLITLTALILYLSFKLKKLSDDKRKAQISSEAKSLFMQKVIYEFRNPLNGILGFSQMLESGYFGELNTKQQERIRDIYQCGNQLQNLVKDFLDLSKGENGIISLIETSISISQLIDKALEELDNKIKSNQIRVIKNINDPDLKITCDYSKFIQALKNIIDNAIKFSSKDSQITIKQNQNSSGVIISIADSGVGMNEAEINTIFLSPDDNRKVQSSNGVGIGIPLAKTFVELHGGKIDIESRESLGTTVTINIPISR